MADGLGFENNTRAGACDSFAKNLVSYSEICILFKFSGLITRALAEMTRIGTAYGASPLTFLSLAGVGDLFLTCSSPNSRNYTVGFRLGKGETLDEILTNLGSVAEGVTTTKGLHDIVQELKVYAPVGFTPSLFLSDEGHQIS